MTTTSYLPMILLAIFACGAALTAGILILRSKRTAYEQRTPAHPTQGSLDREGRAGNAERTRKKFGSASMILVGTFSTVAIVGIFIGAIIVYGGLIAS